MATNPSNPQQPLRPDDLSAAEIVDELLSATAPTDARYPFLLLLRDKSEQSEKQVEEANEVLAQYEAAYEKLTKPANRIVTYLGQVEDNLHLIVSGDQEFVCELDPGVDAADLALGDRVRVNDAYAILGKTKSLSVSTVAKVSDVLPDGRLRIGTDMQGSGGRVVPAPSELVVKQGDDVIMDASGRIPTDVIRKSTSTDYFLDDVPQVGWERVGGQDEAKRVIREAIEFPLLYPDLYKRFGKRPMKGILLYGPPGCGKTMLGKATAYNLTQEYNRRTGLSAKECFLYINGPKILNMWLGESERQVREIFATARQKAADGQLVFIFIDEAESILRTRSSGRFTNISNTVVPQFCAEMDGIVGADNIVVMLTSNRPDYIDPAILRPERIDRRVRVRRPDRDASADILQIYLNKDLPFDDSLLDQNNGSAENTAKCLVEQTVQYIWQQTAKSEFLDVYLRSGGTTRLYWKDLVSGALLSSLVERAKSFAIRRAIETENHDMGMLLSDFTDAVDAEYKENEIFPKSDLVEDWLMLIDQAPENVADVKPIRGETRGAGTAQLDSGII
ncbi:MAG: AAA family ATPase [Armatimonadota bacterium]